MHTAGTEMGPSVVVSRWPLNFERNCLWSWWNLV